MCEQWCSNEYVTWFSRQYLLPVVLMSFKCHFGLNMYGIFLCKGSTRKFVSTYLRKNSSETICTLVAAAFPGCMSCHQSTLSLCITMRCRRRIRPLSLVTKVIFLQPVLAHFRCVMAWLSAHYAASLHCSHAALKHTRKLMAVTFHSFFGWEPWYFSIVPETEW